MKSVLSHVLGQWFQTGKVVEILVVKTGAAGVATSQGLVDHLYNPSYSESKGRRLMVQGKIMRPYLKN
jgi:hypothetical protein